MAMAHGEKHPSAKMTADKVRALRRLRRSVGFSYAQLADLFGISTRSAWLIDKGYHWKHIEGEDDEPQVQSTPRYFTPSPDPRAGSRASTSDRTAAAAHDPALSAA